MSGGVSSGAEDCRDGLPAWGLLVREPFAGRILAGLKTWEIRRYSTARRGRIGIVTDRGLIGTVLLHDVLGPFSVAQLAGHVDKHRAPLSLLADYAAGKRLYAWVMRQPVRFAEPVRIRRRRGPMVWIALERAGGP